MHYLSNACVVHEYRRTLSSLCIGLLGYPVCDRAVHLTRSVSCFFGHFPVIDRNNFEITGKD